MMQNTTMNKILEMTAKANCNMNNKMTGKQWEKQKAYFSQEEATAKMYKWTLGFIFGYFLIHLMVGIIRFIF